MSDDTTSVVFKIGSWVSVALGPILSEAIPMASDLKQWAFWISGIASLATLAWLSFQLTHAPKKYSSATLQFAAQRP